MARVKRGVTAHAKHKKVLKAAKGFYGRRKNTIRIAKQAVEKANQYAYRDRKRQHEPSGSTRRGHDRLLPKRNVSRPSVTPLGSSRSAAGINPLRGGPVPCRERAAVPPASHRLVNEWLPRGRGEMRTSWARRPPRLLFFALSSAITPPFAARLKGCRGDGLCSRTCSISSLCR